MPDKKDLLPFKPDSRDYINSLENNGTFIITDTDGIIISVSQGFSTLSAYSESEALGSLFPRLLISERSGENYFLLKKAVLKNKKWVGELCLHTKKGMHLWLHVSAGPLLESGEITGVIIWCADITSHKNSESALRSETEALSLKLKELTDDMESFTYSISHDFRAPLRAIDGYSKILMEDFGKTMVNEERRLLDVVISNARKMNYLMEDLLAYSRIGRHIPAADDVNLQILAEKIADDMKYRHGYTANVAIDTLPGVKADESILKQVFRHLLSNAFKFTRNTEKPEIYISATENADGTVVCIKDNGAGFNMDYASKLFKIFQKLHSEDEYEGNGTGLAMVKRLLALTGDEAWGEGREDSGAAFFFTIKKLSQKT